MSDSTSIAYPEDRLFRWVEKIGFPAAMVIGLVAVLYFLGTEVVESHSQFVKAHIAHMEAFTRRQDEAARDMKGLYDCQMKICHALEGVANELKRKQ